MNNTYENYLYYRNKSGYSDYKISCLAGLSKSTISDWKTGKHHPHNKTLKKIADILGIDVNAFYNSVPSHELVMMANKKYDEMKVEQPMNDSLMNANLSSYKMRLTSGEEVELSPGEYKELQKAVTIFVDSWIRSQKQPN